MSGAVNIRPGMVLTLNAVTVPSYSTRGGRVVVLLWACELRMKRRGALSMTVEGVSA